MKKIIIYLLVLATMLAMAGCAGSAPSDGTGGSASPSSNGSDADQSEASDVKDSQKEEPFVVRIGDQPNYFLLKIAQENGYFEDEFAADNIKVEVTEFVGGPAMVEAMGADSLDLGILGPLPTITANANDNHLIALSSANYTADGFALFVTKDSGITSTSELAGKTIAIQLGTTEHEILLSILKNAGLGPDDVKLVNIPAEDAINAFVTGDIDGGIFRSQQLKIARDAGGLEIANNSETGMAISIVVGREAFIKENPEITSRILKVLRVAQDFVEGNPDETIRITSELTSTSIDDTKVSYESRNRLVTVEDKYFTSPIENTLNFALEQKLINKELKLEDIIDTSYFEAAGIEE